MGDAFLQFADGRGQPVGMLTRRLQHVKRQALRALRPDAGQALQFLDEARERFRKRHSAS